jgi:hypothetical protein
VKLTGGGGGVKFKDLSELGDQQTYNLEIERKEKKTLNLNPRP